MKKKAVFFGKSVKSNCGILWRRNMAVRQLWGKVREIYLGELRLV